VSNAFGTFPPNLQAQAGECDAVRLIIFTRLPANIQARPVSSCIGIDEHPSCQSLIIPVLEDVQSIPSQSLEGNRS
jgi:hypothetical protein